MPPTTGSALTLTLTALAGKAFVRTCLKKPRVEGLDTLLGALRSNDPREFFASRYRAGETGTTAGCSKSASVELISGQAQQKGLEMSKEEKGVTNRLQGRRKRGIITCESSIV